MTATIAIFTVILAALVIFYPIPPFPPDQPA